MGREEIGEKFVAYGVRSEKERLLGGGMELRRGIGWELEAGMHAGAIADLRDEQKEQHLMRQRNMCSVNLLMLRDALTCTSQRYILPRLYDFGGVLLPIEKESSAGLLCR